MDAWIAAAGQLEGAVLVHKFQEFTPHLELEGYPVEQGARGRRRGLGEPAATTTHQASPAPCSSRSKPRAAMVSRMAIEPKLQAEWIRR